MKLDLEERGGVSVLVLSGNLTIGAEGQLLESVETLLEAGRDRILVDFGDVPYMDSAGIGELLASYKTVKGAGGALKILKLSENVQNSLQLTRLLPMFEVFDDADLAVASFGEAPATDA